MYTEPIPNVQKKEVPATNEAPQFLKTIAAPAVIDSSVASGTDRGVSESVAEVPTPADPSADPYKRVCEFFSTTDANEEQWKKDLRDNMMELFVDAFRDDDAKRIGESVPQSEYKPLGIGYGPLGGQQFPEACAFELMLGPQGEPVYEPREPRMNDNHDEKGQFTSGGSSNLYEKTFGKVGDTKTAEATSEFTANKNLLVASYSKEHSSDFYKKSESYSGHSTLKVPEGFKEENMVGFAQAVHQSDGSYNVGNVEVQSDNRRQGVATKLYDAIEKATGQKLSPSPLVSNEAQAFWKNRNGERAEVKQQVHKFGNTQGEPIFRFNENHDEKGQFTSGVTAVAEQGGHAGGGVSSEEELARPGKHYIVDKHGRVSYHGKSFAPEETPLGGAHVTVKPNGDFQVNAGTLTESMKSSLAKAVLRA